MFLQITDGALVRECQACSEVSAKPTVLMYNFLDLNVFYSEATMPCWPEKAL